MMLHLKKICPIFTVPMQNLLKGWKSLKSRKMPLRKGGKDLEKKNKTLNRKCKSKSQSFHVGIWFKLRTKWYLKKKQKCKKKHRKKFDTITYKFYIMLGRRILRPTWSHCAAGGGGDGRERARAERSSCTRYIILYIITGEWIEGRRERGGAPRGPQQSPIQKATTTRLFVRVNYTSAAMFLHERFRVCN